MTDKVFPESDLPIDSRAADIREYVLEILASRLSAEEREVYSNNTFPFVEALASNLPKTPHKELLLTETNTEVVVSRTDAAVLLAAGLLCQWSRGSFDFYELVRSAFEYGGTQIQKVRCLLHYFETIRKRMIEKTPETGETYDVYSALKEALPSSILIQRVFKESPSLEFWKNCDTKLCNMEVKTSGLIEDVQGALQIDFANKYIGGGVLGYGCVQEEIRFTVNPECLISLYFIDSYMSENECIIILGTEQFSKYSGYARSFAYAGPHIDQTPIIKFKSNQYINTTISAIDAMECPSLEIQFQQRGIVREARKAYIGFQMLPWEAIEAPVATGNWGCGAFGGNIQIKSMIQWFAASAAGRQKVDYFTFNDPRSKGVAEIAELVLKAELTVAQLWQIIASYNAGTWYEQNLFSYIAATISGDRDSNQYGCVVV